jgi:serine/threonine protein phosphatase PrpC
MDLIDNSTIDFFIAEKPLELVNGDTGFINVYEKQLFVGIVDGAGHGLEAHSIAQASRDFIEKNKDTELPELMSKLHNNLRGTRGAVAIIGKLDHDASQFHYVGIGNIVLRKFGNISERAITQDGVIGYQIRTPNEKIMQITSGDILIMHTDGLASTFDINDYPEILRDNAEVIANNLIDKFGKNNDDATCVVIRFN